MIFAIAWAISARIHALLQRFAPSNIIIRRARTRTGLKWGPLVGAAGIAACGAATLLASSIVRAGGPGWVNLIALVAFWDGIKFTALIPDTTIRLLATRHREKKQAQVARLGDPRSAAPTGAVLICQRGAPRSMV